MKKVCSSAVALCVVALLATNTLGLEIRVAPATLVLSSQGGNVTVHTDFPFGMEESVLLEVDGSQVGVSTFADDCGNLVAQCSKQAVEDVLGDIGEKFVTVPFTLTVNGDSATEDVRVKR